MVFGLSVCLNILVDGTEDTMSQLARSARPRLLRGNQRNFVFVAKSKYISYLNVFDVYTCRTADYFKKSLFHSIKNARELAARIYKS